MQRLIRIRARDYHGNTVPAVFQFWVNGADGGMAITPLGQTTLELSEQALVEVQVTWGDRLISRTPLDPTTRDVEFRFDA